MLARRDKFIKIVVFFRFPSRIVISTIIYAPKYCDKTLKPLQNKIEKVWRIKKIITNYLTNIIIIIHINSIENYMDSYQLIWVKICIVMKFKFMMEWGLYYNYCVIDTRTGRSRKSSGSSTSAATPSVRWPGSSLRSSITSRRVFEIL